MSSGIERRRTIRIRRSHLLECKLGDIDRPALKIIDEHDEYFRNFRLVYNEYRDAGYTPSHPSRMLYNIWSLLPSTSIFVFKSFQNIISTVSLIPDSDLFGLPIDAVFKPEVDELRQQGKKVAEIGALATTRMRRWSNVVILLFKALFYYAGLCKIDEVVVMVNPKHVRFYTSMFLFEPFGEAREYEKVGAPAVPLRLDMTKFTQRLEEVYSGGDFETDLHAFFTNFSDPLLASVGNAARGTRKALSPYSAYFFLRNRRDLLSNLTEEQKAFIKGYYHQDIFAEDLADGDADDLRRIVRPVLESMHLENRDDYIDTAFSRNLGLLDYSGQRKLLDCRVGIPGLGGVGGVHLSTLARTGIGAFNLADFDSYSPVNINRQYGAGLTSFSCSKLLTMRDRALNINPFLDIRCFTEGVTRENLDQFLEGVDIVVDGLDFFVQDIRRELFNRALEKGIPVITAAPAGFSSALLVFMPGGPNYDAYFGVTDTTSAAEQLIRFSIGVAPRPTHMRYMMRRFVNIYDKRVPSLDIGCQLAAGMAATEVVNIVTKGRPSVAVPQSSQFDAKLGKYRTTLLFKGVNSPLQRLKVRLACRYLLAAAQMGKGSRLQPEVVQQWTPVPEKAFIHIVRAAIKAPSGDNVQPWRFSYGSNEMRLFINREADTSFFNVRQVASLLASGAALQNMKYAAGGLGLESRTEIFPEGESADTVARMQFTPTGVPYEELMNSALWRRCTNRRMYQPKAVPFEVWDRLIGVAGKEENVILLHTSSRPELKRLARAVYLADRVRVERRDLHEYLMSTIRFDPVPKGMDELNCREDLKTGMPLKNLQAGLPGDCYLKAVRSWRMMNLANKLGLGRAMPLYGGFSVMLSGGVGLLCSDSLDEKALVRAGMAMQRLWCHLDQFGYSLQPLAAVPLFTLRMRMDEGQDFSGEHAALLEEAWDITQKTLSVPSEYHPVFMFRTGIASPVSQRCYRQPPEDLIISGGPGTPG